MKFTLTDLAAEEIESLEAGGIRPTAQEVLTIQQLSLEATEGDDDCGGLSRGTPYEAGGEWLYPPTIAGSAFYAENERFASGDRERLMLLAYAMRFGRDPERIYARGRDAIGAARKWAKRLRCTVDELAACMDRVVGEAPPVVADETEDPAEGRRINLALVAAALVGGPPEMWETQVSFESVCKVIETAFAQKLAVNGVAANDPRIRGLRRLGLFVEEVRRRHGQQQP